MIPHGEAWLLETLAMFRLSIWRLTWNERTVREWLNRGFHQLSPSDLERVLRDLFDRGDIEAFYRDDDDGFTPSARQLQAALQRQDKDMYCGVSRQGGVRWESLANPNWARYFQDCGWDGGQVEITAGSRSRLLEIVENSKVLWDVAMDAESLEIRHTTPWNPLPWKHLPDGFRANVRYDELPFVVRSREATEAEPRETWNRYVQLRTWATSICGNAYV